MNIYLRSCIGVEHDLQLIPHFIDYYKNLGVTDFLLTLSSPTSDHKNLTIAKSILSDNNINPIFTWIGKYKENRRKKYLRTMVKDLKPNNWIVTADCDEFQEYPTNLIDFTKDLDENKLTWTRGYLIDRLALNGVIPKSILNNDSLFNQFPLRCNLHNFRDEPKSGYHINGQKFMPKVPLHKQHILLGDGNHFAIQKKWDTLYDHFIRINHFKWFGSAFDKVIDMSKSLHQKSAYTNLINHLSDNGKFDIKNIQLL